VDIAKITTDEYNRYFAELQNAYHVDFDVEEIESLRSYNAISTALRRKAASVYQVESNNQPESR